MHRAYQPLYILFVDLTKALDTVGRAGLWQILNKLGCPDDFVKLIRSFHDGMEACVSANGELSASFKVENGVKQGCVMAPNLFSIFFAATLQEASRGVTDGVFIRFRTEGSVFNLSRLRAKTKVSQYLVIVQMTVL